MPSKKIFRSLTQEFKRLSLKPVVAQGPIYYTFLNISVAKLVKIGKKLSRSIYVSIYVSGTKPQGLFKTDPLSVPASWQFFSNTYFRKKLIYYTFQMLLSRFEQKKFLNFLVKYSTSAHYGGHTIYSFPKSVEVLHYWVQMNILTKYGDQWMTGVPVIMLQRWHIS